MENKPINPLFAHFRQPSIYFRLPSHGNYWKSGLDMPVTQELPVYPMTSKDEITLKTPDALLNGQGVVDVIQSCCPNITNAWEMPSVDVDATLIAIRIASYGNEMNFESKCPHCGEEHNYAADLGSLLSRIVAPDYSNKLHVEGLRIKLQPQKYLSTNETGQINYQEQRVLQSLSDPNLDDATRVEEYKKHMERLIMLNTKVLADSTEYIEIESSGTIVTERNHIYEFYQNCSGGVCKAVKDQLVELGKQGSIPPMDAVCSSCSGNYSIPLTFDYSSFFGIGS